MSDWKKDAEEVPAPDWMKDAEEVAAPSPVQQVSLGDWLAQKFAPESKLGTALRGVGQGASLGLSDEMAAGVGANAELLSHLVPGIDERYPNKGPIDAAMAVYRNDRAANREDLAAGAKENPKTAMAAEVAGSMLLPVPGGAAKVGTIGRFGQMAKTGAAMGGVYGFGKAEGDVGEQVGQTVKGAAVGGVLTPVLGAVGSKGADKLSRAWKEQAENKVIEAINQPGIADRVGKVLGNDPEVRRAFARRLLDSKAVRFGDNAENIMTRAVGKMDELGEGIGAYIDTGAEGFAKNAAAASERNAAKISGHLPEAAKYDEAVGNALHGQKAKEAGDLTESLIDAEGRGYREPAAMPLLPAKPVPPTLEPVPNMRDEWRSAGERMSKTLEAEPEALAALGRPAVSAAAERVANEADPTMRRLYQVKSGLQGGVNYNEMAPVGQSLYRDSVRALKDSAHDTIAKGLSGDDFANFQTLNSGYSDQAKLLELVANRASREGGKRAGTQLGTETASRAAELMGGAPGAALGAGIKAADSVWSRRGQATAATAYDFGSKALAKMPATQYVASQTAKWAALQSLLSPDEQKRKSEEAMAAADRGTPK